MDNTSGFKPAGARLLVLPDEIEETFKGSSLVKPEELKQKEPNAQIRGTLIAVGPGAWLDTTIDKWAEPGDMVLFGKYTGIFWDGKDGKRYRIINDVDLVGHITE
jgi:co-chaperonin GroES (HSP10)